jgi:hypothetical protein
MQVLRREELYFLPIHDLGTRCRSVVSVTLRPLFFLGETPVTIGQEAWWDCELIWTQRLYEKCYSSTGDLTFIPIRGLNPGRPVYSQTILETSKYM